MEQATNIQHQTDRRRVPRWAIAFGLVYGISSALLSLRSYSYSDSLTFLDTTVSTDEGLLSFQFPLVRLAQGEKPRTDWMTYTRGKIRWEADDAGKTRLRDWMATLDPASSGGILWGFGYWKGGWQSNSRKPTRR